MGGEKPVPTTLEQQVLGNLGKEPGIYGPKAAERGSVLALSFLLDDTKLNNPGAIATAVNSLLKAGLKFEGGFATGIASKMVNLIGIKSDSKQPEIK